MGRLLDAAEEQSGGTIDLDADHYWSIDPRAAFDPANDPEVDVGQLSDDTARLRELLGRKGGEVFLWHDLEHMTAILERIAALARP